MTLLQELGIVDTAVIDLEEFAADQPVTQKIGNWSLSVVQLPNGPVAPYVSLSGSPLQLLEIGFSEYAQISANQPVAIAEKIGAKWFGTELTYNGSAATTSA